MTEYGLRNKNPVLYEFLLKHVDPNKVNYILHHAQVPIDARPCAGPLSQMVQAIMTDSSIVTASTNPSTKDIRITVS